MQTIIFRVYWQLNLSLCRPRKKEDYRASYSAESEHDGNWKLKQRHGAAEFGFPLTPRAFEHQRPPRGTEKRGVRLALAVRARIRVGDNTLTNPSQASHCLFWKASRHYHQNFQKAQFELNQPSQIRPHLRANNCRPHLSSPRMYLAVRKALHDTRSKELCDCLVKRCHLCGRKNFKSLIVLSCRKEGLQNTR